MKNNNVATIGFFDGVHQGHRYLLRQVTEEAAMRRMHSLVVTFPMHPRKVLHADFQPQLLTIAEEKLALLRETGVDDVALLPFTKELAQLSAYEFMRDVLRDKYDVRVLVIGYDHRFGHNRSEGFDDYVRYGKELGMEVVQAKELLTNGRSYSSTYVRKALSEGKVDLAGKILGRHYSVSGEVVSGFRVGHKIGYPTANLSIDPDKMIPCNGVYAVRVIVCGEQHLGMLNIGKRPTLDNGEQVSVEVNILDFDKDIYSQVLTMEFLSFIREEKRFDSLDELRMQIASDEDAIRKLYA